jgi:hypothetical protein
LGEILRRGRFEDLALLTSISAMVGITIIVFVIQMGAPTGLLFPAIGIFGTVAIVAAIARAVGNARTNRALNRAMSRFEPRRRHVRPYVFCDWLGNRCRRSVLVRGRTFPTLALDRLGRCELSCLLLDSDP